MLRLCKWEQNKRELNFFKSDIMKEQVLSIISKLLGNLILYNTTVEGKWLRYESTTNPLA